MANAQELIGLIGVECPAPETEPLEESQRYYIPSLNKEKLFIYTDWYEDEEDFTYLKRGLIHLTESDAIAHSKALILASGGSIE